MTAATHRPPMKPRDIRRRAYSLMRQCWLTLLIAAVLISLPVLVRLSVEAYGERLATEAYNAAKAAYLAEHHAGDEFDTSWVAVYRAEEAYDEAFAPWEWLGYGIDLVSLLFQYIIVVRLCRGLLNGLGTGTCSPRCLLDGRKRTLTSCWMALQISLLVLVWILLPLALTILLSSIFGRPGELIGLLLVLIVSIWARLRYSLAVVHLADHPENGCPASDCLYWATNDMNLFTIRSLFCTIWPLFAVGLVDILLPLFVPLFPALDLPVAIFIILSHMFIFAAEYTCYVCIYDEIRQRIRATEEATPPTEGLARARALANGESIT